MRVGSLCMLLVVSLGLVGSAYAGNGNGNNGNGNGNGGSSGSGNSGNGNGNNGNGNGNGGSNAGSGTGTGTGTGGGTNSEFVPDLSQPVTLGITTQFVIVMREQAIIEVPAVVNFNVVDVAQDTPQAGLSQLRATHIVLAPGHRLLIQIAAAADRFRDQTGAVSYQSTSVLWTHGAVTGGTGVNGHLGAANAYQDILSCNPRGPCTSDALTFKLAADPTQSVSGVHTLLGQYRVSSIL